jgi:glutamate-1-semialdehyde 2,1-aminomutase
MAKINRCLENRTMKKTDPDLTKFDDPAENYLVGGVTSGWNEFCESGHIVVKRGEGARIWDAKDHEYIDWIMGWGSLLLGHNPQSVFDAIYEAINVGFGFQYETDTHRELAKEICQAIPGAEKARLANTGSEATLHALRVARQVTGRSKILKFEGHFHGLNDYLLYGVDCSPYLGEYQEKNGSIKPIAGSAGLPDAALQELILIVPFNDISALQSVFEREGENIAAVILEPIALNIGCIAPDEGFLQTLREICDHHNSLLIYDEVLTGFRIARGGAGELFGVTADLVCLGKALGCGMPVAALTGKREYMEVLTPKGEVQMAGTNTGRHMTVRGTLAALKTMGKPGFYAELNKLNDRMVGGSRQLFERYNVPAYVEGYGGRIGIFLGTEERPRNFREVVQTWNRTFHVACYRKAYYEKGLFGFLLPLGVCPEPITLSAVHTPELIDETLNRLEDILKEVPYH